MLLRLDRDDPVERDGFHDANSASARGSALDLTRRVTSPSVMPSTTISPAPFFTARSNRLRGLPVATSSTDNPAPRNLAADESAVASAASSSTTITASIDSAAGASIIIA